MNKQLVVGLEMARQATLVPAIKPMVRGVIEHLPLTTLERSALLMVTEKICLSENEPEGPHLLNLAVQALRMASLVENPEAFYKMTDIVSYYTGLADECEGGCEHGSFQDVCRSIATTIVGDMMHDCSGIYSRSPRVKEVVMEMYGTPEEIIQNGELVGYEMSKSVKGLALDIENGKAFSLLYGEEVWEDVIDN